MDKLCDGGGGVEPDLKRRRLLDAGGPVEDDETARQKMRDARVGEPGGEITGFDPDDVVGIKRVSGREDGDIYRIKPMGYFAQRGDLPMMRWLYVNGADTRDDELEYFFPMYSAALKAKLEACKWLYEHGSAQDIKRRVPLSTNPTDLSPLSLTSGRSRMKLHCLVSRWLILKGALCKDDGSGDLDLGLIEKDIRSAYKRRKFLEWSNRLNQAREAFLVFLAGTLSPPDYSHSSLRNLLVQKLQSEEATDRILGSLPSSQHHQLWGDLLAAGEQRACPVSSLSGKSGVLETIYDFLGIVRGREARIVRQLTEVLPDLSKDTE